MRTTRRNVLKGGGKAVAAAALPVVPTVALGASDDAKLLSHVEVFWPAHNEANTAFKKWIAEKHRVEALPECPQLVTPAEIREAYERYVAFFKDHGVYVL